MTKNRNQNGTVEISKNDRFVSLTIDQMHVGKVHGKEFNWMLGEKQLIKCSERQVFEDRTKEEMKHKVGIDRFTRICKFQIQKYLAPVLDLTKW